MTATILDGEALAAKVTEQLKTDVAAMANPPHLVAVQVGDPPASRVYVRNQRRTCEAIGLKYTLDQLPEAAGRHELLAAVDRHNADAAVSGIILQMPLPEGVNPREVQWRIDPAKDVEGMVPANIGRLVYGASDFGPCTPLGALELIKLAGCPVEGAHAVVVGHSEIVGKPMVNLLLGMNATVTCCHIFTPDITPLTRQAEILVVATGARQARWQGYRRKRKKDKNAPLPDLSPLVKADMVRDGACVIDVGINRIPRSIDAQGNAEVWPEGHKRAGKPRMITVGDCDFDGLKEKAGWLTPVPGGAGPMTVAILLRNCVELAKRAAG
jgi:methylenetetrahydrofolate dehydrogenase (NADP+)/methenyltetrahydrofolate cyclohydrolase